MKSIECEQKECVMSSFVSSIATYCQIYYAIESKINQIHCLTQRGIGYSFSYIPLVAKWSPKSKVFAKKKKLK